jgi:hypothetical protein
MTDSDTATVVERREISDRDILRRDPLVDAVELDGESVLYDRRSERLHLLNSSATVIWTALDGVLSVGDLVDALAEAFGIGIDDLGPQVRTALSDLESEKLLRRSRRRRPADQPA